MTAYVAHAESAASILVRAQEGDRDAFTELVEQNRAGRSGRTGAATGFAARRASAR